ncbi:response regulator [Sphaerospermopsis aphanizomenoides BCCUSP55]|uniref:response regulator n=1 Tax=Sphaerospermopsis aphanizomenoides TaxID=459663 RepID=UPI000ABFE5DB|nr:response regulator [Sphaerospermopsis aphanizomenoides]MBK1987825.1 response regulator [Sphaerospermopsis aphanizomenoides BCCUSP55]
MAQTSTLLIIEDNPDDIELTLLAFEQTGLRENIVIARDGVEAINYLFTENPALDSLPDLILLDLQLPRINGLEVLQQIRSHARTKLLPIVILTTSHEESDRLQGYSLGCNSYICKPVDYDQFVNILQQLGMYWLIINSPPPLTQ